MSIFQIQEPGNVDWHFSVVIKWRSLRCEPGWCAGLLQPKGSWWGGGRELGRAKVHLLPLKMPEGPTSKECKWSLEDGKDMGNRLALPGSPLGEHLGTHTSYLNSRTERRHTVLFYTIKPVTVCYCSNRTLNFIYFHSSCLMCRTNLSQHVRNCKSSFTFYLKCSWGDELYLKRLLLLITTTTNNNKKDSPHPNKIYIPVGLWGIVLEAQSHWNFMIGFELGRPKVLPQCPK